MTLGHSSCTILLDDAQSTSANPTSRLYKKPFDHIIANSPDDIKVTLQTIQQYLAQQKYVVANFSYELGEYFQGLNPTKSTCPWIEAWVFDSVTKLSALETDNWIEHQIPSIASPSGLLGIHTTTTAEDFESNIHKIHELIRRGETYQVNYTYRIKGQLFGSPLSVYHSLRNKQPGPFGAYIEKIDGWVLSCSPEWFLRKDGSNLIAKPMKGTGKVGEMSPSFLKNDPKNRAENLMIVDLLRNDLGKISIPGSIKVPDLFEVEQHGDVLQMTSTVEAKAHQNLTLLELLQAIFPCGSVTGTPKKKTMEIIQALESEPRGLYCGAIAWFDPPDDNQILGNLGMSVVIRTLTVDQDKNCLMGIGAGITIDSGAQEEWQECQTKANFLYQSTEDIGLFETIRISNQIPQHLDLHLHRMGSSAHQLDMTFDPAIAVRVVMNHCQQLNSHQLYRLRLELKSNGELIANAAPIDEIRNSQALIWASDILGNHATMHSSNRLLGHKVTLRKMYDIAWQEAEKMGAFDAIFVNEFGHVTEGGRSNIFIKQDGQWLTPPLSSGCLPGIMRSILIKDPAWSPVEKNITVDEVLKSEKIVLTNALRGIVPITLN